MPLDLGRWLRFHVPVAVSFVLISCALHPAAAWGSALPAAIPNVADASGSASSTPPGSCWGFWAYPSNDLYPDNVVIGDMNEDGINDLVTSGRFGPFNGSDYEALYIALGQATAGAWSSFGYPAGPFEVASIGAVRLADINDDGILDVIGCRTASDLTGLPGGIDVYFGVGEEGVGDGQVGYGFTKALPYVLTGLRLEDFNEDGILDAAAWPQPYPYPSASDSLVIMMGLGSQGVGSGRFANPVVYRVGGAIRSLEAADLDEDGILDLVVGTYFGAAMVLRGQGAGGKGNGSFTPAGSYATGRYARIADLTEDGIVDLVSFVGADLQVRPGLGAAGVGDGTFGDAIVVSLPLPTSAQSSATPDVYVADIDQDGRLDVVRPGGVSYQCCGGHPDSYVGTSTYVRTGGSSLDSTSFVLGCGTCACLRYGGEPLSPGLMDINGDRAPDYIEKEFFSGEVFHINEDPPSTSPTITLVQPTGGELWTVGSERRISWTRSPGWADGVSIEVSRDGGANWEPIAHDLIDESWVWTVTPPVSSLARIRVRHQWTALHSDVSPADFTIALATGDVAGHAPPASIALSPARPNPTNGRSQLTLTLPGSASVNVVVTDATGRLVRTLAEGALGPGRHELSWDGTGADGRLAPAGVYWVEARSGSDRATRRIVRLQ